MTYRRNLLPVLGAVFLAAAFGAPRVSADEGAAPPVTVEQIVGAWNARSDGIRSLRFSFTDTSVHVRKNVSVVRNHELVVDGSRYRHEWRGENWVLPEVRVRAEHQLSLFNGTDAFSLIEPEEHNNQGYPAGGALTPGEADDYRSEAHSNAVWPVFHTFRSRQPWFLPLKLSAWRINPQRGTIRGRTCVILDEIDPGGSGILYRLWVDPERNFIALRKEMGSETHVNSLLDVEYIEDSPGDWVPHHWTDQYYGRDESGKPVLVDTSDYNVTDYALNGDIDDKLFEFEFPPGTVVKDQREGRAEWSLARDSGTRIITEDERQRGARYSDLVATESGEALLPPAGTRLHWVWLAGLAAIAGLGWLIMRRR